MSDELSYADTLRTLQRLGDSVERIVLIGGQALNFWAEQYAEKTWELGAEAPYSSKDIDFCGTQEDVGACAVALQGRPAYQSNKARSLCTGLVTYVDDCNNERQLDFLTKPYGLESEDIWKMSIPATITAEDGK